MENLDTYIFQIDSDFVKKFYTESENIKVLDDRNSYAKLCVIYFSSNELYYPNTEASFLNAIADRDKYEWQNNLFPGACRHVLVRDIQKQWYIEGVSTNCNSPELLVKKLQELCLGFDIYTIGSSAGGFGALLFGSILVAKRVYAFNAQMDLNIILRGSSPFQDPILFKYQSDIGRSKFYQISNSLTDNTQYFYFQSSKSQMDIVQYNACSKKELLTKIEFLTSNHGFPFLRHDLKYVLQLPPKNLKLLAETRMHPIVFSIKIHGFVKAAFLTLDAVKNRFKKKLLEKKHAYKAFK